MCACVFSATSWGETTKRSVFIWTTATATGTVHTNCGPLTAPQSQRHTTLLLPLASSMCNNKRGGRSLRPLPAACSLLLSTIHTHLAATSTLTSLSLSFGDGKRKKTTRGQGHGGTYDRERDGEVGQPLPHLLAWLLLCPSPQISSVPLFDLFFHPPPFLLVASICNNISAIKIPK